METKVYLASYKSTQKGWHGLVNRLIRWATKSEYSHSEICVGNPFLSVADCLSSVGSEGGVRIKSMQLSTDKWDIVELKSVKEKDVLAFYEANKGTKYDFIGCVRTMLPWVSREHENKFFCSEVAATIIGHKEPWRMYPGVLHVTEVKNNHEIIL